MKNYLTHRDYIRGVPMVNIYIKLKNSLLSAPSGHLEN